MKTKFQINKTRQVSWTVLLVAILLAPSFFMLARTRISQASGAAITGNFYADFDRNGTEQAGERISDTDPLFPANGISVSVFDHLNASNNCSVAGNSYSCDVSTLADTNFRIEFNIDSADFAAGWNHGFGHEGTPVRHVSSGQVVNFAYIPPSHCPQTGNGFEGNPNSAEGKIWTTCFTYFERTNNAYPTDVLVGLNYDSSGEAPLGDFAVEHIGHKNGGFGSADSGDLNSELGSVWGVAYNEWSGTLFTSAMLKRHSDLGSRGLDGLYWVNYPSGTWQSVDLDSLGGPSYGVDPTGRTLAGPSDRDADVFSDVAKTGIGDIDVTPDGKHLLVTNLSAKSIGIYDISNIATGGSPVYLGNSSIANPGCSDNLNLNDYQIWAVKTTSPVSAYIGVHCTGENSSNIDADGFYTDLEAHLVPIDLTTPSAPVVGASALTVPLDYSRGCGQITRCNPLGTFEPWDDNFNPTATHLYDSVPRYKVTRNQPVFSDIEILEDGSMVLGFFDRFSNQMGEFLPTPSVSDPNGSDPHMVDAQGEMLHICNTSGNPLLPVWVIEGDVGCDSSTRYDGSASNYLDGWDGFGNPFGATEWYGLDKKGLDGAGYSGHTETFQGGLYTRPRNTSEIVVGAMDPVNFGAGGLAVVSTIPGDNTAGRPLELYEGSSNQGLPGKGNSIGDVEGCYKPMQIGGLTWFDNDNDGTQDGTELKLENVKVELLDALETNVISTTYTNSNGEYYFDSSDGVDPNTSYIVRFDKSTNTTTLPNSLTNTDLIEALLNNGYGLSADSHDSDLSGSKISVTTTDSGQNDHSFDAGYSQTLEMRLGNQIFLDTNNNGLFDTGESGIEGVTVELFEDKDMDGIFEPGADDGTSLASTTTTNVGRYWFEGLGELTYFVAIPDSNTAVDVGAQTIDLNTLFNSNSSSLSGHTSSSYEPDTNLNVDNGDDGRDDGNATIPAGYITFSDDIVLNATTEPTAETLPGGAAGADETEANAQAGSFTPDDNNSNLTVDFGFYSLPDLTVTKTSDTNGDASFSNFELLSYPGVGGNPDPSTLQYQIVVNNQSQLTQATATMLTDIVPPGVTITSVDSSSHGSVTTGLPLTGAAGTGSLLEWNIGNLAASAQATLVLNAEVSSANAPTFVAGFDAGASLQNVAQISSMTEDDSDSTPNNAASADYGGATSGFNPVTSEDDEDDARITIPPALGNIVWHDINGNGIQDGGSEIGIAGVTVTLYADDDGTAGQSAGDTQIASVPSASDGSYWFGNLNPGTNYYIMFDHSTAIGYDPTTADQGADSTDSDGSITQGYTGMYVLAAGEINDTVDMGYTSLYSIGNRVWLDNGLSGATINDGVQQPTEPGITGVQLRLTNSLGVAIDDPTQAGVQDYIVTTDSNGYYRFDQLVAGDYIVEVVASSLPSDVMPVAGQSVAITPDQRDHGEDIIAGSYYRSHVVTLGTSAQPSDETDIATGNGAESPHGNASSNLAIDFGFVSYADITVSKSVSQATYNVGVATNITYTIDVSNVGPADLSLVNLTDGEPSSEVTFNSWTCAITTPGSGSLTETCSNSTGSGNIDEDVTLNSGGVATFTIDATVSQNALSTIYNTANVSFAYAIQDPSNDLVNYDDAVIAPQLQTPSVAIDKQLYEGHDAGAMCNTSAAVDQLVIVDKDQSLKDITYCFSVTNNGNTHLNSIAVTDSVLGITNVNMTMLGASATAPIAPGEQVFYYYDHSTNTSISNTAAVDAVPTTADGTPTGQANVNDSDPAAELIYVFDPPYGLKTGVLDTGESIITWDMIWINDSVVNANGVVITDEPPVGTNYLGNLVCSPQGTSTVSGCSYEAPSSLYPRGRVVVVSDIASDPGATTPDEANNEVIITFDVTIDSPDTETTYENQGEIDWGGVLGTTDDPTRPGVNDPAIVSVGGLSDTGSSAAYVVALGALIVAVPIGVLSYGRNR